MHPQFRDYLGIIYDQYRRSSCRFNLPAAKLQLKGDGEEEEGVRMKRRSVREALRDRERDNDE